MLTGARPFGGTNISEVLAEVIKSDPDWEALPDTTPGRLRQVVRRCLQKDPQQRLHDVADLRLAMAGAFDTPVPEPTAAVTAPSLQMWQRPISVALLLVATGAVVALAVWASTRPGPPELMRFSVTTPASAPLDLGGPRPDIAVSPDGTQIVYTASTPDGSGSQLYLRTVDHRESVPLQGGENGVHPFFRRTASGLRL